jgi:hypothetical protein
MASTWGARTLLDYLNRLFIYQKLPDNATPEDILFWVRKFKEPKSDKTPDFI